MGKLEFNSRVWRLCYAGHKGADGPDLVGSINHPGLFITTTNSKKSVILVFSFW